jgi:hypothetical protein
LLRIHNNLPNEFAVKSVGYILCGKHTIKIAAHENLNQWA